MPQRNFIYRPMVNCECAKCNYWRTVDRTKFLAAMLLVGIPVIVFLIWIVK